MSSLGIEDVSSRAFRSLLERTSDGSFPEGSRSLKRRSHSGDEETLAGLQEPSGSEESFPGGLGSGRGSLDLEQQRWKPSS